MHGLKPLKPVRPKVGEHIKVLESSANNHEIIVGEIYLVDDVRATEINGIDYYVVGMPGGNALWLSDATDNYKCQIVNLTLQR